MKIKPILWAIVVSPLGFRGPSESQEPLESHPVIPPKLGYAKNRAEDLEREGAAKPPTHTSLWLKYYI